MPATLHLPPGAFALRTAVRALLVWLLARVVATLFIHILAHSSEIDPVRLPERLILVGVAVAAALHFARRRGELLLLADLGVAPWSSAVVAAVPALMVEAALWMLVP